MCLIIQEIKDKLRTIEAENSKTVKKSHKIVSTQNLQVTKVFLHSSFYKVNAATSLGKFHREEHEIFKFK